MAGALGCFAFGVGSTDMANAWFTRDVRVTVPETARFVLTGALAPGVCAKDVMLHILAQPFCKSGKGIGKVLEFAGDGVAPCRSTSAPRSPTWRSRPAASPASSRPTRWSSTTSCAQRGLDADDVRERIVQGRSRARTYARDLRDRPRGNRADGRDCPAIRATASRCASSTEHAAAGVRIDIAYGGSCTGGKKADMDMYAAVLGAGGRRGASASPRACTLYIQFGSQDIRRYAEAQGLPRDLREGRRRARRPLVRRVHQGGPGRVVRPGRGHRVSASTATSRAAAAPARSTWRARWSWQLRPSPAESSIRGASSLKAWPGGS